MHRFDCKGWSLNKESNLGGALFFAQRWQEMLFDYTFDSYRHKTFNLLGLCEEMKFFVDQCEMNVLRWGRISSLRDELVYAIENDRVGRDLLIRDREDIVRRLNEWRPTDKHPGNIVFLSHKILDQLEEKYLIYATQKLLESIQDVKRKESIDEYAEIVLTELIRRGISQQYIYQELINCFFSGKVIDNINVVSEFLDRMPVKEKNISLYFQVLIRIKLSLEMQTQNLLNTLNLYRLIFIAMLKMNLLKNMQNTDF